MTEPKKWRDMTPEEKGALLLAHHEGKGIELLLHDGRWAEAGPAWDSDICYRVKPPEPRVWWLVMECGHSVITACRNKELAGALASHKDRSLVRVVECPDG